MYVNGRLLSILTIALIFSPADAGAYPDLGGENDQIDTLFVTATKRSTSLKDTPIAITVIDADLMQAVGLYDILRLPQLSPSLSINRSTSESGGVTLRLRGVGTTGNNIGLEGAVGVFLDGVYLSRPGVALSEFTDLAQIEVLRGPQGTLFGRNTSAGVVHIKSSQPSLTNVQARAAVTYGNENLVRFQGALSVPVVDDAVGFRISGAIHERDGYFSSVSGAQSQGRDRSLVRAQLLIEPNDLYSFRLSADYSEDEALCCDAVHTLESNIGPLFAAAGLGSDSGTPAVGRPAIDAYRTNADKFSDASRQYGISGELKWQLGFAELSYIGAHRTYRNRLFQDADFLTFDVFGTADVANTFPETKRISLTTHEARLSGDALASRLDWLVGFYASDEAIDDNQTLALGTDYQAYAGARLLAIPGVAAAFGPTPLRALAGGVDAAGSFAHNRFTQKGFSYAVFTHNVVDLSDRVQVSLGARYTRERKDGRFEQIDAHAPACNAVLSGASSGALSPALAGAAIGLTCFQFAAEAGAQLSTQFPLPREFNDRFEDDAFTYVGAVDWELSPEVTLYASHSAGFKAGGFNLDPTAAVVLNGAEVASGAPPVFADPRFGSEQVRAYETGLKSTFANGRGSLNIAAYHQDIDEFQVLEFTGVQFKTFNVPKVKTSGVEIEASMRLGDYLFLRPAIAWTNARYPDDCDRGQKNNERIANLCGEQLTNAPMWTTLFGAQYEAPVIGSGVKGYLGGDIRFESERRTSTQATPIGSSSPIDGSIQRGNLKLDLRAGLKGIDEGWSVELWGRNITDERTQSLSFDIPLNIGARAAIFDPPATYGVSLRFDRL